MIKRVHSAGSQALATMGQPQLPLLKPLTCVGSQGKCKSRVVHATEADKQLLWCKRGRGLPYAHRHALLRSYCGASGVAVLECNVGLLPDTKEAKARIGQLQVIRSHVNPLFPLCCSTSISRGLLRRCGYSWPHYSDCWQPHDSGDWQRFDVWSLLKLAGASKG